MKRVGHYGVALAVAAPAAAWLAAVGFGALAIVGAAAVVVLAMLPDVDLRLPLVPHRGPTHSLAFAVVVGIAAAAAAAELLPVVRPDLPPATARSLGFGVGALAVLAHLAADALTPAGVPVLWPLSDRRLSLGACSAGSRLANWALLALGVAVGLASLAAVPGSLP